MFEIARDYNVDVIQPLVTAELEIFSEHKKMFDDVGIAVCVSPIDNLSIANDKGAMFDSLRENKLDKPEYVKISEGSEFEDAARKMGFPDRSICFKPTRANEFFCSVKAIPELLVMEYMTGAEYSVDMLMDRLCIGSDSHSVKDMVNRYPKVLNAYNRLNI